MTQEQERKLQESLANLRRAKDEIESSGNNVFGIPPIIYILVFILLFGFSFYTQVGKRQLRYPASTTNYGNPNNEMGQTSLQDNGNITFMYSNYNDPEWEQLKFRGSKLLYTYPKQKRGSIELIKVGEDLYRFPKKPNVFTLIKMNNSEIRFVCNEISYDKTFTRIK